jgi:hypothetical protein
MNKYTKLKFHLKNYIISSVSGFFHGIPIHISRNISGSNTQYEKRTRTRSKVCEPEVNLWQRSRLRASLWHASTAHTMNHYVTFCLDTNQQQPATRPSNPQKLWRHHYCKIAQLSPTSSKWSSFKIINFISKVFWRPWQRPKKQRSGPVAKSWVRCETLSRWGENIRGSEA